MKKTIQLLTCPFCGQTPTVEPWHGGKKTKVLISCPAEYVGECGGAAPSVTGETLMEAVKLWNTRSGVTIQTIEYDHAEALKGRYGVAA